MCGLNGIDPIGKWENYWYSFEIETAFYTFDLNVPEDVVVENVHLSDSLMRLSYRVSSMMDERERKEKERLEKEV